MRCSFIVDKRSGGRFYLSTRQHAVVKGKPAAQTAKLDRLRRYQDAFRVAAEGSALTFEPRPSADRKGANESEIGVLFFDNEKNTVEQVIRAFPSVHRSFVERLPTTTAPEEAGPA